jgi:magnesium-transporting ATPase (P-type)
MYRWSNKRPFSRVGALAFFGLAFCVFIWGLQYKLSLYDPPDAASHHIPTAKLLSKNEQSSFAESPQVFRTRTATTVIYTVPFTVFLILLLIFSRFTPAFSREREQHASRLWHLRRAHLRACFVRPPPVFI